MRKQGRNNLDGRINVAKLVELIVWQTIGDTEINWFVDKTMQYEAYENSIWFVHIGFSHAWFCVVVLVIEHIQGRLLIFSLLTQFRCDRLFFERKMRCCHHKAFILFYHNLSFNLTSLVTTETVSWCTTSWIHNLPFPFSEWVFQAVFEYTGEFCMIKRAFDFISGNLQRNL